MTRLAYSTSELAALLTADEVAVLLRVSSWTVASMTRDGRLPKVPGIRRIRIPRDAVEALLEGGYHGDRGESDRQAPTQETPSGRGYRRSAPGSLARKAVGGGGALPRRVGPTPEDVVIRRVTPGS